MAAVEEIHDFICIGRTPTVEQSGVLVGDIHQISKHWSTPLHGMVAGAVFRHFLRPTAMVVPIWATLLILTSIAGDVASVRSTGSETRGEDDQGSHGSHGGADTKLTPCIVAQRAAAGWADAFVPDCTDDGFFERRQCHLFVRTCWCVDSATGAEIDGTRRRFDEGVLDCDKHVPHTTEIVTSLPTSTSLPPTPPSEDSKETDSDSPCLAAQQAVAGQPEAFLPSCSASGLYERRQCHYFVMQCWCVDPATGTEVEGSRKSLDEGVVDCDRPNGPAGPCHVARSRSSGLMGAFVPQCTDDGKFRTLQCHGSTGYCWCVNEAGVEMENTRKGPSEGPVDCDAVKPANDPAGPCHVARSSSSGLMGAYVPQCTDDGKFRTLQCHGSTGYCWCVNEDGVEMENTRKSPSEGPVDCGAARPANGTAGPCHVARSRSSGLIGSTGYCWCVNEDGVEMENTRKSPSEGPVDCSDVGSRGDEASASETPTPTPPATPKPTPPATPTPTPPATPTPTALPPTAPPRSCSLPPLTGPCDDVLMRWYFDRETETCKQFAYGGCEGNGNNFDSKTKCEFACPPNGCPAIDCDLTCQYSYQVDSNNCHVCRCTDPCSRIDCASGQSCVVKKIECGAASCPSEVTCVDDAPEVPSYCSLPTDAGTCDNNTMRWYFNSESKSCIEFSYRGCGGNRNNFKTKIECVTACQEPCPLAMCLTKCKFGYKKGDNGCYTCNCYEPCEGVDCSHGDECVAVNTTCAQPPCAVIGHCTKKGRIMRVDCTNPADAGPCGAEYPRWFYDSGTKECRKFFYGGCHGNSNNFEWREDCERVCMPEAHCRPVMCLMGCSFGFERDSDGCEICECVDPCKGVSCSDGEHCQSEQLYCASPPCAATAKCIVERPNVPSVCSFGFEAGGCSERVQKWFYNATSDQCVPRNFSSCYGNNNRFENRNQCESTCKPTTLTCRPVTCRMMCPFGFAKADNGCAVCQCINPCQGVTCRRGEICLPERRSCEKSPCPVVGKCFATRSDLEAKCSLPLEVGLCSSRQSRWFFNTTSSHCEAFNYTGCRGNDNRFETRSACKQTCEPHRCEPVRCKMFCPFGWVKDVNGCDICQCVNPCKNVTCLETERCMPERRACMTSSCPVLGRCFPKRPDLDSRCTLAQDVGLCTSDEMKWFFNVTSNKCEAFNFTGCRGNRNRFDSKTECDQACEPHRCEPVRCRMFCPFGWAKDESGCEICQCVNPCKDVPCSEGERCLPERRPCPKSPCPVVGRCFATRPDLESRCSMTIDVGSCNSREQNWFFNVTSNKCEAFNYTGCRGNGNRFDSVRECNQTCVPHRCEPVRCRMFCPFGWAKDESGCEICKCVNPCKDVRCSDGEHCLPERRQCDKSPCPVVGKCFAKRPHMESRCSLAQEVGLCNSRELKWFFNVTSNKCEAFNYTGCRGNGNRFNSTTECNETCEPHRCEPVRCKMFCPFGWAKDESGCEICQCVNPCEGVRCSDSEHCLPERRQCVKSPCPVVGKCYAKRPDLASRCSLALEVGLCHSRELRWFFNVTSNKCEAFNYTGCRGNGNRFDSVRECNQTCVPHRCEPVRCKMFCPFGWAKDESGCEICKCVNPCKDVSCSNREHCLPERRQCDKSPCPVVGKCFGIQPLFYPVSYAIPDTMGF
ncbi:Papilin [Lamellibrachia satsuma]|nr:Papilin [Lamellibrachia satsuma]